MLFNVLMGFFMLLMLALMVVNPKAKKDSVVKLKSNIMIEAEWDGELESDVDLFIQLPNGKIVFYNNRDVPGAQLSRDDRGSVSDKVVMPDGSVKIIKENWEHAFISKTLPGWYTVNVVLFNNRDKQTIPVKVKIQKFKPYELMYDNTINLIRSRQEKTVIRFKLNENGDIMDINDDFKSLKRGGR